MSTTAAEFEPTTVENEPSVLRRAWDSSKVNLVRGTICVGAAIGLVALMAAAEAGSPRALIAVAVGLIAGVVNFGIAGVKFLIALAK